MIIITRSEEESTEFKKLLKGKNLSSFTYPCLEYETPSDGYAAIDECIRKNHEFDWIVFLSKKSADVFFTRVLDLGGQLFHLSPRLRIACIGDKTASYVRDEIGFPVDFIPSEFNSDCFIKEFHEKFFPGKTLPSLEKTRIIIPRQENIEDDLVEKLEANNQIEISTCPAYKVLCPTINPELNQNLIGLLKTEKQVYISFASSNTVTNFKELSKDINLDSFSNIKLISIGPKTTETIKAKFPNFYEKQLVVESQQSSFESMIESILADSVYQKTSC